MRTNLTESRLAELWNLARSQDALRENKLQTSDEILVLKQYQVIHDSMVKAWQSAPNNVLDRVKAIMPHTARKFSIGRLVHPRPMLGFARGTVSQIQFESEEVLVRIQLEEIPNGWRMWGRTSQPGWSVWSGESSVACNEEGEFELDVQAGSVEPLSLQNESTTILLPMIVDEIGDGNA